MQTKFLVAGFACVLSSAGHAAPYVPDSDAQIVARVPVQARSLATSADARSAAQQARALIEQARAQADPRALGQAQALLARWWDKADAPAEIAVLQATILQSNHEFAAARALLEKALARSDAKDNAYTQAWLTLATIERVTGNYAASLQACDQVSNANARLYGAACRAETESLQGRHESARRAFVTLSQLSGATPQARAWLASLAAENEERGGQDDAARALYQQAQNMAPDRYTALALADHFLRTSAPRQALNALQAEPASDAVLIRRAAAYKRLQDARWQVLATQMEERFSDEALREGAARLHAREIALFQLTVRGDANAALAAARVNLTVQREPLDWWLALQSARAAGNTSVIMEMQRQLAASGLIDARLQAAEIAKLAASKS